MSGSIISCLDPDQSTNQQVITYKFQVIVVINLIVRHICWRSKHVFGQAGGLKLFQEQEPGAGTLSLDMLCGAGGELKQVSCR